MAVVQEFKCPCCDGAVEFDSTLQKMKCPYCDTEFDVADLQAGEEGTQEQPEDNMQWDAAAGTEWQEGETEGMRVYTCNTCGGEIVAEEILGEINRRRERDDDCRLLLQQRRRRGYRLAVALIFGNAADIFDDIPGQFPHPVAIALCAAGNAQQFLPE